MLTSNPFWWSSEIKGFEKRYEHILEKGFLENPLPVKVKGKRGRAKQSKAKNLAGPVEKPPAGNPCLHVRFLLIIICERDLRMIKVKQKISGVFRSDRGAKMFCRIRGYISTARKNSRPVLDAIIKSALEGNPFIPEF